MNKTKIEYLTYTWSPLTMRCTPVSAGCKNCWHLAMAKRLAANPKLPGEMRRAYAGDVEPLLVKSRLDEPLRLRKPATIGVQFMGDLWHDSVYLDSIWQIWRVMRDTPRHTYVMLTKRSGRMQRVLSRTNENWGVLPNVIGMVSVENQEQADKRVPDLLQTPLAVRGVSMEPMLGAVDLWIWRQGILGWNDIDWVICGSESGYGARPMDEAWVRDIRNQCVTAGVPFFYKQKVVDGKKISLPELDGKIWNQYPDVNTHQLSPV